MWKLQMLIILTTIVLKLCASSFVENISSEREARGRLYDDLAAHRALTNQLVPLSLDGEVEVSFAVWVNMIREVVEAKQTVESHLYMEMMWSDPSLAWVPEHYANISHVIIPLNRIWHPTIYITNSADSKWLSAMEEYTVDLFSDGTVQVRDSHYVTTSCTFDLTYYPLDTQVCRIVIMYDGQGTMVRQGALDLMNPAQNESRMLFDMEGEWTLENRSVQALPPTYGFQVIRVMFTMKRATLFYILCVLLPMVVASVLTLLVFWIPPGSGEKLSFLVSIYVSTALYVNFIGDTLPRNISFNKTPRMTQFLVFVILECVMALVSTIFVIRRYEREKKADVAMNLKCINSSTAAHLVQAEEIISGGNREASSSYMHNMNEAAREEGGTGYGNSVKYVLLVSKKGGTKDIIKQEMCGCRAHVTAECLDMWFFWIFSVSCVLFYSLLWCV